MLVLDGCFMLEFLVGCCERSHYSELGYDKDDPIFSKLYMCYGILMDMILIENQIPLFILDRMYKVQFGCTHNDKVTDLMFEAFNPFWVIGKVPMSETGEKHILSSSQLKDCNTPRSCLEAFWQNLMYSSTTSEWKKIIPRSANGDSMPVRAETKMAYGEPGFGRHHMESPRAQGNEGNAEQDSTPVRMEGDFERPPFSPHRRATASCHTLQCCRS